MNDRQRDLDFMQSPGKWPKWPLLPLAHRTLPMADDTFTALLFSNATPTIYFGNLMMLPPFEEGMTWGMYLGQMPSREYPSFEALVADYRVD
jgi:hypothetical protein